MSDPNPSASSDSKVLTVPLNDDGTIGALPEVLQRKLDASIAEAVKRTKAKADPSPVEAEELRQLRAKMGEVERQEAERKGEYEKALKMREDTHAAEMTKAQQELARRTARLKESVKADIRAAAIEHGARKESLSELETLLSLRVTLDEDTLAAKVLGDDGQPSEAGIGDLVKGYLDAHAHHRTAPSGGGGARGGASMGGAIAHGSEAEYQAALDVFAKDPSGKNWTAVQALKAKLPAARS